MIRRTAPSVALGTLVGLVLGAVAYVTVSAGGPDPVPVSRVSSEGVADPVVLGVPATGGSTRTDAAVHVARATSDDTDDADDTDDGDDATADGRGDDEAGDDVVTVPATRDDDEPSARASAGHDDDSDDGDDDSDDDSDDEDDDSDHDDSDDDSDDDGDDD